jgi:hypothetical protein
MKEWTARAIIRFKPMQAATWPLVGRLMPEMLGEKI